MALPNFIDYFQDDVEFQNSQFDRVTYYHREIGDLLVPSGRIVACDPLVDPEAIAFTKQVQPGRYPVVLSIVRRGSRDERIALAMVRFSNQKPVRWELAITPENDLTLLKDDEFYGYGVDAGTGCFMSEEAANLLSEKMDEDVDYYELIEEQREKNYVHTRDWADFVLDADSGLNIIAFSSGLGDGLYGSYWGYDEANEVVCLVTDFNLIDVD
jgi:hypothetical protein